MTRTRFDVISTGVRWSIIVVVLCIGTIGFEIVCTNLRAELGVYELLLGFFPFLVAGIVFAVGRLHLLVIACALALFCLCDTVAEWHLEFPALSLVDDAQWVAVFYPLRVALFALPVVCAMRWLLGRSAITGRSNSAES